MKVKIVARTAPCKCGCQGKDPWHARTFEREIHDVKDVEVTAKEQEMATFREGNARFPWGDERVVEVGPVGFRTKWWQLASINTTP